MKGKRVIVDKKVFDKKVEYTFENFDAATQWCNDNNYGYGSMSRPHPEIAIMKGDYNLPQKWKNMTVREKNSVDGVIHSNDYRNGIVEILIYKQ